MNYPYETRTRNADGRLWQLATAIAVAAAGVTCQFLPQAAIAGDTLPSGEKVLANYVSATGGEAAYRKIHNRMMKGYIEFKTQPLKMNIVIHAAAPNKMHIRTETGTFGTVEEGCDGTVAWATNPMMGPQVKEGTEREQTIKRAVFYPELDWKKLYEKLETVGVEDVDGSECYKVVATSTVGKPETFYYDKKTHLLTKVKVTPETPMGELEIETVFSDYKKFDGVLIAQTRSISQAGQEMVYVIEEIKQNIDLPKDTFDLPDAIKELIEKGKSKKADKKSKTQTDKK